MNWLTNFVRPKIRALVQHQKTEVPDNLWVKCPGCGAMLFHRELEKNLNVCHHCGHHLRVKVDQRLDQLFDNAQYEVHQLPAVPLDPLKFKDRKKYTDRLKEAQTDTGHRDGLRIASGTIGGSKAVIAAFDFEFMGGSMGIAVGSGIVRAGEIAVKNKAALIVIPASGGARMQEGILSLMQMPRTTVAVQRMREAKLPYIVLLTDPTYGGVSASFAMLGDIHIAEPGAQIGFAGKRVIQETIREQLPENFQGAEYLLDHGAIDLVVPRKDLPTAIGKILGVLLKS
jgi:acetyl-CoA carboxylase carboxyl transferase subunit beta